MGKILRFIVIFIMEKFVQFKVGEKFLKLKRLIILKYVYTESIKVVTFLKKKKRFSLLLEMTLILYNVFNIIKKVAVV